MMDGMVIVEGLGEQSIFYWYYNKFYFFVIFTCQRIRSIDIDRATTPTSPRSRSMSARWIYKAAESFSETALKSRARPWTMPEVDALFAFHAVEKRTDRRVATELLESDSLHPCYPLNLLCSKVARPPGGHHLPASPKALAPFLHPPFESPKSLLWPPQRREAWMFWRSRPLSTAEQGKKPGMTLQKRHFSVVEGTLA